MKLEKLNLTELTSEELLTIEGGRKFPSWEKIKKYGGQILTAIETLDVVDRFIDGWNSHKC